MPRPRYIKKRVTAANALDKAMVGELEPLRLGNARFKTNVIALDQDKWTETGADRVAFAVATNPGSEPGPLNKIASGGEVGTLYVGAQGRAGRCRPRPGSCFR